MTFKKGNKINEGRKQSASHIKTRIKVHIGKKLSEEHKQILRERMINNNPNKNKHPWNYIDGRSKLLTPARYGDDWDKIRYLVYCRDRFTCQDCGKRGERLDVHHKIPFLESYDNSLENLITLCRSCHMKREKIIINKLKGGK